MHSDAQLLEQYVREGGDGAFAEIVRRHLNVAWAVAFRVTGDAEAARDVAQTVFVDLARKARHLPRGTVLAAWVHRAAFLAACKANRGERRRRERERQAMNDASLEPGPAGPRPDVEELLPRLDEALAALGEADRSAVVLRFLSGRSLAEVGSALQMTEDTARKRVARALDKLRAWFGRRGNLPSDAAVLAALGVAGAQMAPAGLAGAVTALSVAGVGTLGVLETLLLMKTKIAVSVAAVAAVAAPLTYQQMQISNLRDENRSLEARLQQAVAAEAARAGEARTAAAELERLQAGQIELLRLRAEAGKLRTDAARLSALEAEVQRLRAASAPGTGAPEAGSGPSAEELEAAKEMGIAKLNAFKHWGLALHLCASERDDTLPATLAEAREFLSKEVGGAEVPFFDEDVVELTYAGPLRLADIKDPARTILARERQPWVDVRGRLARTYVFADGHSEIRSSPDGDFTVWERERGVVNP